MGWPRTPRESIIYYISPKIMRLTLTLVERMSNPTATCAKSMHVVLADDTMASISKDVHKFIAQYGKNVQIHPPLFLQTVIIIVNITKFHAKYDRGQTTEREGKRSQVIFGNDYCWRFGGKEIHTVWNTSSKYLVRPNNDSPHPHPFLKPHPLKKKFPPKKTRFFMYFSFILAPILSMINFITRYFRLLQSQRGR